MWLKNENKKFRLKYTLTDADGDIKFVGEFKPTIEVENERIMKSVLLNEKRTFSVNGMISQSYLFGMIVIARISYLVYTCFPLFFQRIKPLLP